MQKYSRVCAVISLDAVEENFRNMRANTNPKAKMIAVVKADGYGHGAVPVAKLVEDYDYIWGFAVATAEEAQILRKNEIQKPILILGYTFEEHFEMLVRLNIRPVVFKWDTAKALSEEAGRQGKTVTVHLGLDTGMSRIGFTDTKESIEVILEIAKLPNLKIEGLFTHFARSDEADKTSAWGQLARYQDFLEKLSAAGIRIPLKHCSNSAGIIDLPEANMDAVRPGISIYGIYPSSEVKKEKVPLKPVMQLKSHIVYIKELEAGIPVSYGGTFVTEKKTKVATIPVGYGDGYPRSLSGKGWVLIHGKKAPILGRVCMDQFMVDISDIDEARELDEVTLFGESEGAILQVEELSSICGRFPYEFVCDIGKRIPRIYVHKGEIVLTRDYFDE
ncbi:MAG: alanine racemase [Clostridiales bacterium]|nr:alanine racemase [Clostridiales bacterium]MDU3243922.1 alanine racemase [Clostridiales bacterium]